MGRPRKAVTPQSFSVDTKLLGFVQALADKKGYTMSHVVNMALAAPLIAPVELINSMPPPPAPAVM